MKLSSEYNPVVRAMWALWDHLPELIALALVAVISFGFVWIANVLLDLVGW